MTTNNPSGIDPKDRDAKLTIQGLGADSTPYVSQVKSFRELGLKSSIVEALAGPVGWLRPSQIQGAVLRMLKDGTKKNIVAQAAFGSGKTGMFGLAMLNEVDEKLNALQCVCIAPARELATQIYKEITNIAQMTGIRCFLAVRGCGKATKAQPPHIIIGTPGTIRGKLKKFRGKTEVESRSVKMLVLDEADEMLKEGNLSAHTLDCAKQLPHGHRTILVSATFPEETDSKGNPVELDENEKRILRFMNQVARNPIVVRLVKKEDLSQLNVPKYHIECKDVQDKLDFIPDLYDLQTNVGQSIVFCNTRRALPLVAKHLTDNSFDVSILHGGLTESERDNVVSEFKKGKTKMLIATDVIAKGFNVPEVSVVVNFDIPLTKDRRPNRENYLHRVGRAGRFGRNGLAINLIDPTQRGILEAIEAPLKKKSQPLPRDDLDPLEKVLMHVKKKT